VHHNLVAAGDILPAAAGLDRPVDVAEGVLTDRGLGGGGAMEIRIVTDPTRTSSPSRSSTGRAQVGQDDPAG
jgi:hypothetical protein